MAIMPSIRIVAIGSWRSQDPEYQLYERYVARLRPRPELTIRNAPRGTSGAARLRAEAGLLLEGLAARDVVVVLDESGEGWTTQGFARQLGNWAEAGQRVSFLIGGADGLDPSVRTRAGTLVSLGRLTWPHQLVRAMLAEQLYRAHTLMTNHPYHRGTVA